MSKGRENGWSVMWHINGFSPLLHFPWHGMLLSEVWTWWFLELFLNMKFLSSLLRSLCRRDRPGIVLCTQNFELLWCTMVTIHLVPSINFLWIWQYTMDWKSGFLMHISLWHFITSHYFTTLTLIFFVLCPHMHLSPPWIYFNIYFYMMDINIGAFLAAHWCYDWNHRLGVQLKFSCTGPPASLFIMRYYSLLLDQF